MKIKAMRAWSVFAFVLVVNMTPSLAQQPSPGGMMPPGGMMMPPGMQPPAGMMPFGDMASRGSQMTMMAACPMMAMTPGNQGMSLTDMRIASLGSELAIKDNQKAAWNAYTEAVKRELQGTQGVLQSMQKVLEAKTPVERLDAHAAAMESRLTALRRIKPALANFYTVLTPEQKKKADEVLTGSGCVL